MVRFDLKYKTLLNKWGINTPLRVAHFMAQIEHESGFKLISENLNYSAQGLANTWPSRYAVDPKAKNKTPNAIANRLHRKPQDIANNVYANRMGNGDEKSNDGWNYRGRAFLQITGKGNYEKLSKDTGIDYVNNPDKLLIEADSMTSACWYWKMNNLNKYADRDDLDGVSDLINIGRKTDRVGDSNGYEDRKQKLRKWKNLLKI